jgi:hypothetical protein
MSELAYPRNLRVCDYETIPKICENMRFVTVFLLAENLDRKPSKKNGGAWPRLPINRDSGRWQLSSCANVVQKCLLVRSNVLNQVIFEIFFISILDIHKISQNISCVHWQF